VDVVPISEGHAGSAVALAWVGTKRIAFVADEDDGDVHAIDAEKHVELSATDVGGAPAQLLVLPDGRIAVTLRDRAAVALFTVASKETAALRLVGTLPAPAEPIGLALTPDDATLLVTSGWGHALSAYRPTDGIPLYRVNLPREPRAVVVSGDGKRAYVSHVVGATMSVVVLGGGEHGVREVELRAKEPPASDSKEQSKSKSPAPPTSSDKEHDRGACQGFALAKSAGPDARVLAPEVLVDPGDASEIAVGYGSVQRPTEVGNVAVLEDKDAVPLRASLHVDNTVPRRFVSQSMLRARAIADCLLPRAAAYDPKKQSVVVACLGIDQVIEYDATAPNPHAAERRRWRVPAGPMGLALDPGTRTLVIWSQFDRTAEFLPFDRDDQSWLEEMRREGEPREEPSRHLVAVSRKPSTATQDVAEGRKLFHAASDPRISADGRACASCHPDGRDDSLTWQTPEGPRNTPMLAGRVAGTAPYGWIGSGEDVSHHLKTTFVRLGGQAFSPDEEESLVAYITTMRPPPDVEPPDANGAALLARGRELFASPAVGCAGCHVPDHRFTDSTGHDVGSADAKRPEEFANLPAHGGKPGEFDTPSLRFVAGTAPYFHDGRYATLRDVLLGSDGSMGHVSQLSPRDLAALEVYLRTL
jgi:cytochrome c peroxidase